MSKEHPPEGQLDKTEARDENEEMPIKRFKSLTRRLLNVSNIQLREELVREAKKKATQRKRKGV